MVPLDRTLISSYRLSIVTMSLSCSLSHCLFVRVSESYQRNLMNFFRRMQRGLSNKCSDFAGDRELLAELLSTIEFFYRQPSIKTAAEVSTLGVL